MSWKWNNQNLGGMSNGDSISLQFASVAVTSIGSKFKDNLITWDIWCSAIPLIKLVTERQKFMISLLQPVFPCE